MDDEFNYDNYYEQNNYEKNQGSDEDQQIPSAYQRGYSQEEAIEEQPYEIVPLSRLYDELEHILREIECIIYLDLGWCLLLLKEFKWDKDNLIGNYYNDNEAYLKKIGFRPNLQDPNFFDRGVIGVCDVCCTEDTRIFYNICNHNYCVDCWLLHIKNNIQSGSAFPRCMDEDCRQPLLLQSVNGILKCVGLEGENWLKKYQKRLCELFITTNNKYQFCTGVDCGNCIKLNLSTLQTVTCVCGKIFCFKCQSDDHYPCKCDQKGKWAEQVLKEEADAKWISTNAKICPSCKKAVERSMGCNFMACTCGKNFCYMCSGPWQPDHKDHFKCHIYRKKADQIVNREKEIMERMNHCTERYIFNQAVANNYKEIDVFAKRKYLFRVLHIELTESQFMESAFRFAIQCCQKLKWIYAFTYFHEMTGQHKESFQFYLGQYEKYKENLLKLLAADLKMFMQKVEQDEQKLQLPDWKIQTYNEQFKFLKKQIVNLYTCTKSYKDKFVDELKLVTQEMDKKKESAEFQKYYKEEVKCQVIPLTKAASKKEETEKDQGKAKAKKKK